MAALFLRGRVTLGVVYYASFKLTGDRIDGLPLNIDPGKSKVFALGPEVSAPIERNGVLYGFVKANYQWEPTRVPGRRAPSSTSSRRFS